MTTDDLNLKVLGPSLLAQVTNYLAMDIPDFARIMRGSYFQKNFSVSQDEDGEIFSISYIFLQNMDEAVENLDDKILFSILDFLPSLGISLDRSDIVVNLLRFRKGILEDKERF